MIAAVVVPARDEAERIGACLQALAAQTVSTDAFIVVVVLDGCRDATADVVARSRRALGLQLITVEGPGTGPGGPDGPAWTAPARCCWMTIRLAAA